MASRAAVLLLLGTAAALVAASPCDDFRLADPACASERAPDQFNVTWCAGVEACLREWRLLETVITRWPLTLSFRTLTIQGGQEVTKATVEVQRVWAPLGADRFYNLAKQHFFDSRGSASDNDAGFFRVVPGFVVQFGIPGNSTLGKVWESAIIDNDPVVPGLLSNVRGTIAYAAMQDAQGQATGRTTQVFVNLGDNSRLDGMGFTAFGRLDARSMEAFDLITSMYGEQPDQDAITTEGDLYLRKNFPFLDYVRETEVVASRPWR